MNPLKILEKYCDPKSEAYSILVTHSRMVHQKAHEIALSLGDQNIDLDFIYEASMLHDIGVVLTNTPDLGCHGEFPYICHGYLGRKVLEKEGLPRHALVCERHTGVGLTKEEIVDQDLPIPHRDMMPESIEEKIICYADNFFSKKKDQLTDEKSFVDVEKQLSRFGEDKVDLLRCWADKFSFPPSESCLTGTEETALNL